MPLILRTSWKDPISAKDWLRKFEGENLKQLGLAADFVGEIAWRKGPSFLMTTIISKRIAKDADNVWSGQNVSR